MSGSQVVGHLANREEMGCLGEGLAHCEEMIAVGDEGMWWVGEKVSAQHRIDVLGSLIPPYLLQVIYI